MARSQPCHPSHYTVQAGAIEIRDNPASIKEIMEAKVRANAVAALERLKEEKYDPHILETVLRKVVPFYHVIHKVRNDPGYRFEFEDIAGDLLALGLTLVTLGGSFISIRGALQAARMAQGAGAAARASIAIRASLEGFKTSSFLIKAGKELTDFVVPVFTAKDILAVAGRGAGAVAARGLRTSLRHSDGLMVGLSRGNVLDRIYDSLHVTRHTGPVSPHRIKEIIDERAGLRIPPVVYRGQRGMSVRSPWGHVVRDWRDDYLAAIVKHSARTGGSTGEALSLSMDKWVARRFVRQKTDGHILRIDTSHDPENFRTIESIIRTDGPRLVEEGRITAGTLAAAVRNAVNQAEKEVFYVLGNIPDEWIEVVV